MKIIHVKARTTSPFYYCHIPFTMGQATLPNLISDRAIMFAINNMMGYMTANLSLPEKNYKKHIANMPVKSSVFLLDKNTSPRLLPPLARRHDIKAEGGEPDRVRRATGTGNFKDFFYIQEVPFNINFYGCLYGEDPFEKFNTDTFSVKIGANRGGTLQLTKESISDIDDKNKKVALNVKTAQLFNKSLMYPNGRLVVEKNILWDIQLSPEKNPESFMEVIKTWK